MPAPAPSQPLRQMERPKSGNRKRDKKKLLKTDITDPITDTFIHLSGVSTDGSGGMKIVDNTRAENIESIRL